MSTQTRETLKAEINAAQKALEAAQQAYDEFDQAAENNVFPSLEDAEALEDVLANRAFDDCQGAYNCGNDVYEQEFMVGDVVYVATLKCEYNRHDKTYYYLDGQEFSITPKASA